MGRRCVVDGCDTETAAIHGVCPVHVVAAVVESAAAQGLPPTLEDPAVIDRLDRVTRPAVASEEVA